MTRFVSNGYQIDNSIAIPNITEGNKEFRREHERLNLPFKELLVGESFMTTADPTRVLGKKGNENNKGGKYFVHRHVKEEDTEGIRIWRTR